MRIQHLLDGQWDFVYDPKDRYTIDSIASQSWQPITVPAPWQSQIEGLEESTGSGWYRLTFDLPPLPNDQVYVLHFGAAYHYTDVWFNTHYLGHHEGGWLPFEFVLDATKVKQSNELIVKVIVPSDDRNRYPDFPASETLHGKQSWYGAWGGLWQSVWIEPRHQTHIQRLELSLDARQHTVSSTLHLNQRHSELTYQVDIIDMDNQCLQSETSDILTDNPTNATIHLDNAPILWSPSNPYLYTVRVKLFENGTLIDEITKTSGFRTIEARDGHIWLNGERFYMRGALDQDYYPDTLATIPSLEFLEDQFQKAKALGLNTLRYHIKIADPRYYELADRMGILLWVDLPNWTTLTDATKQRVRDTLHGMVDRDHHHPSIGIWTIVNEDWGTNLVTNERDRSWLHDTYNWLKELDPTRLVVDNSPCQPNIHVETDIADYHYYYHIPDHQDVWDTITQEFADRADWLFSSNGDATQTGGEPLIVSEFGNWGMPQVNLLLDEQGQPPWWFKTGDAWGEGIVYPDGVQRRFQQWHLDNVFGSFARLIEEMQQQQYRALKYEIESIRSHEEIQGYVITELTDTHWENNGLLDMCRNPRLFADELARLNADALVMADGIQAAYVSGQTIEFDLLLSQVIDNATEPITVDWKLGTNTGTVDTLSTHHGVNYLTTIKTVCKTQQPTTIALQLYIQGANGQRSLSNQYPVAIYPEMPPPDSLTLAVDDNELTTVFGALGYSLTEDWDVADVIVVSRLTPELEDYIQQGGRALLVADQPDALPSYQSGNVIYQTFPFVSLAKRESTVWSGDWVSTFSWWRRDHPVTGTQLLTSPFIEVLPQYVLHGFSRADFVANVDAGMFVGWLHRSMAILGYRQHYEGQLAITTFRLRSLDVTNPAQHRLVRHILTRLLPDSSTHLRKNIR